MDELSMGLAPAVVDRLMPALERVRDDLGIPIFFVEQDVQRAIEVADHVYVLDHGEIEIEGHPQVLEDDKRVIETFLGLR
jgi:branched-chain amino acid transport system ATP-binding protein